MLGKLVRLSSSAQTLTSAAEMGCRCSARAWPQEKLRPIDKKLQYQMDKLLRAAAQLQQPGSAAAAAANGSAAAANPLSYGPNPDQLLPKVPLPRDGDGAGAAADGAGDGLADGNGLYRPPRNVAVRRPFFLR